MCFFLKENDVAMIIINNGKCVNVTIKDRKKLLEIADAVTEMMIAGLNSDPDHKEGMWIWHVKEDEMTLEGFKID